VDREVHRIAIPVCQFSRKPSNQLSALGRRQLRRHVHQDFPGQARVASPPRMLRRIPEPGSIERPFHVDAIGIRRRQHDLGVSHIHPAGMVIDRTGALIADTLAGAVAAALVTLLPWPRANVFTCKK